MSDRPVIDRELLAMLRCPDDRTPLRLAEGPVVQRLNEAIAAGELSNRAGQPVRDPLDGGLVREDGTLLYPVVDGIPILLVDEAIPLAQVRPSHG